MEYQLPGLSTPPSRSYPRSPQPCSESGGSEFLTRRFVEKAASNRLAVLHRKLQASQQLPPWRVSPHDLSPGRTVPSRGGSWRPMTPEPSYRSEGSYFIAASPRARSASPLLASSRGRNGRTAATSASRGAAQHTHMLPHHLFNDFIQLPLAGTYRHMDQLYGSGRKQ